MWSQLTLSILAEALLETLYMVGVSVALSVLFGVPLGVLLVVTGPRHILARPLLNLSLIHI